MSTLVAAGPEAKGLPMNVSPAKGELRWAVVDLLRDLGTSRPTLPIPVAFQSLSKESAVRLSRRWNGPCEAAFEDLLEHDPAELALFISSGALGPQDLTFAAEILGRSHESGLVRRTLAPLLSAREPVVREGAIYGVSGHIDAGLRATLKGLLESDPSQAVRDAAKDALSD